VVFDGSKLFTKQRERKINSATENAANEYGLDTPVNRCGPVDSRWLNARHIEIGKVQAGSLGGRGVRWKGPHKADTRLRTARSSTNKLKECTRGAISLRKATYGTYMRIEELVRKGQILSEVRISQVCWRGVIEERAVHTYHENTMGEVPRPSWESACGLGCIPA
jgi:hypothetical protein